MRLGVQEEKTRGQCLSRAHALLAAISISILLLSDIAVITDPFSTDSARVPGDRARISLIDSGPTLVAIPSTAYVNDSITFYANASSDDPGATLTFTIFYDYFQSLGPPVLNPSSPVTVNTTGTPGTVVTTCTYDHPGNLTLAGNPYFWVTVWVNDGMDNLSADIQVYVSRPPVNMPPYFLAVPDAFSAGAGSTQNVVIDIADKESDNVTVLWDFGDGTNATNLTAAPPSGVQLMQTHAWNPRVPGMGEYNQTYFLNVSLSDGTHPPVNSSTAITIIVPKNRPPVILSPGITASKNSTNPSVQIGFSAAASDEEGDPLTWTFNYSDGTIEVYDTGFSSPSSVVWENVTHSFATVGNFTVKLSVSDALPPNQIGNHNITVTTTVRISANVPPTALILNVEPSSPVINAVRGYVNVTLSVEAWDLDGDNFTLNWDLGVFGARTNYSVGDAGQRAQPHTFRQRLTFNATGSYSFAVTVTDGLSGHDVSLNAIANVSSTNEAPTIRQFNHAPYSLGDFAAANDSIAFRLVVTDRERDAIEIVWDFGDGSAKQYMNRTDYDAKGNITVLVNHTYVLRGNYNVTITVTDNKIGGLFNHTLTTTMPIQVSLRPPPVVTKWTSWDYISLSIFVAVPILLVLWGYSGMYRRRKAEMTGSVPAGAESEPLEERMEDPPIEGYQGGS